MCITFNSKGLNNVCNLRSTSICVYGLYNLLNNVQTLDYIPCKHGITFVLYLCVSVKPN